MSRGHEQRLWADRLVRSGWESPEQLLAHPHNPVIHPREQTEAVKGSLNELGWLGHIMVNLRTSPEWGSERGIETVFDGHDRIKAAMEAGQKRVPVDNYDLTPEEEYKAILYLRETARMAVYDKEPLDYVLRQVNTTEAVLMSMLSDMAEEVGLIPPDFEPVPEDEQPRLDRRNAKRVECPECGHVFEA